MYLPTIISITAIALLIFTAIKVFNLTNSIEDIDRQIQEHDKRISDLMLEKDEFKNGRVSLIILGLSSILIILIVTVGIIGFL